MADEAFKVLDISDALLAFPATVRYFVPITDDDELIRDWGSESVWRPLFNKMFFGQMEKQSECLFILPKAQISGTKAFKMLRAWMGTYSVKHEVKEAGAAYILAHSFDSYIILKAFDDYRPGCVYVGNDSKDEFQLTAFRDAAREIVSDGEAVMSHFGGGSDGR